MTGLEFLHVYSWLLPVFIVGEALNVMLASQILKARR